MKWGMLVMLVAVLGGGPAAAKAAELEELVKKSDLVILGQVLRVDEGEVNAELLATGVKVRTDIAVIGVVEALKGDPDLKKAEVGFPGFPKPGEPTLVRGQSAIFLLEKGDQKYYELKTADRILPETKLGAVRRAIRAAAGLADAKPADRAERAAKLAEELTTNPKKSERAIAAYQLADLGVLTTVPALIKALGDESPDVRFAANLALTKITGHRTQVDFEKGTGEERAQGAAAWQEWWDGHKDQKREDILFAAAQASSQPLPDFQAAVEGLAQYGNPEYQPLFLRTLASGTELKNNSLVVSAAVYLGRIKSRASVPMLARLLDPALGWPSDPTRSACAAALGNIVGENFGKGAEAINKALEWWRSNKAQFSGQ